MARILSYEEGEFSTLALDSGEKIMISRVGSTYFIRQMKLMGVFPGKLIARWTVPESMLYFMEVASEGAGTSSPFRSTVEEHMKFNSIEEIRAAFRAGGSGDLLVNE